MSTGQIVGGVVGAVIGYVASGFNPYGAIQSAGTPVRLGNLIASADERDEGTLVNDKQETDS
jgi:hypothetical protein